MKKLRILIASIVAMGSLLATFLVVPDAAYAVDPKAKICEGVKGAGSTGCTKTGLSTLIQDVVNILLFVVGVISVIMIIVGGIRYVTSGGDQSQVTAAKNTVLYSVVGLVVALLAYAIVNFVVGSF